MRLLSRARESASEEFDSKATRGHVKHLTEFAEEFARLAPEALHFSTLEPTTVGPDTFAFSPSGRRTRAEALEIPIGLESLSPIFHIAEPEAERAFALGMDVQSTLLSPIFHIAEPEAERAFALGMDVQSTLLSPIFHIAESEMASSLGIHAQTTVDSSVTAFPLSASAVSLETSATLCWTPLISEVAAYKPTMLFDPRIPPFDPGHSFELKLHRFTFDSPRADPPLRFPVERRAPKKDAAREPIRRPEAPPIATQSLAERLRLILTPPIQQLLVDPELCLPEEPFKYQKEGIAWLMLRDAALLADEMGLGKTMQAILAARLLWRAQTITNILVICPKTLIPNWRREFILWWPHIRDHIYDYDSSTSRRLFLSSAPRNIVVKIINYEAIRGELEWLKSAAFSHDLVIIDEAQRIKNSSSTTARAVKALRAKRRWALTGTPLENHTDDVISIFGFLMPGLLKEEDPPLRVRDAIKPYMLRRTTEDVSLDLPQKMEQDVDIELGPKQRASYDATERDGVIELNAMGESVTVTHVFQLITTLRQICNVDLRSGESAKLDRLRLDLEDIVSSGRKALVFSQFTNDHGIAWLMTRLSEYQPLAMHGGVPQAGRARVITDFGSRSEHKVMLLNYAVGGLGLNLQAANYVFLFDRWWNPAVEDQAVKRAHRLGQKDRVFVRRFVCKETIEERIVQALRRKRQLFHMVIDDARPERTVGLSEEEIFGLFRDLRVRPRKRQPVSAPTVVLANMSPEQFEVLVGLVYEAHGYRVQRTGQSHDAGIDLLAERQAGTGRELIVVQCKHQEAAVGRPVLQQLWGVVQADAQVTQGHLVTSGGFAAPARAFAEGKRLVLVDGEQLRRVAREKGIAEFG